MTYGHDRHTPRLYIATVGPCVYIQAIELCTHTHHRVRNPRRVSGHLTAVTCVAATREGRKKKRVIGSLPTFYFCCYLALFFYFVSLLYFIVDGRHVRIHPILSLGQAELSASDKRGPREIDERRPRTRGLSCDRDERFGLSTIGYPARLTLMTLRQNEQAYTGRGCAGTWSSQHQMTCCLYRIAAIRLL